MPRGFILAIVVSDYPKIPISLEKKPRPTLIKKSVGVYGIHGYIDLNFLMITAMVRPKNIKMRARASVLTKP